MTMYTSISSRQLEIIEAAGKLMTQSGVCGLTTKSLAKEMDFSESALYRHFPGKEDIILTLLHYLAHNMDTRLSGVLFEQDPPKERLRKLFESQISFFKKNPHFVVAVFSEGLIDASNNINEAIQQIMGTTSKHLKPIIQDGQQKGIFTKELTADELTHIVMGTFRLRMFKWRLSHFKADIRKEGTKTVQSILNLISN